MASEILGLFASPELYQQQQNALMQQQAAQYANLNPYERVEYGANLAGRRLGGGVRARRRPNQKNFGLRTLALSCCNNVAQ